MKTWVITRLNRSFYTFVQCYCFTSITTNAAFFYARADRCERKLDENEQHMVGYGAFVAFDMHAVYEKSYVLKPSRAF